MIGVDLTRLVAILCPRAISIAGKERGRLFSTAELYAAKRSPR